MPAGPSSGSMSPRSAHFADEIHRGGRVLTDSPSAPVLADVLVIADEDHGADPGVPRPRQVDDLFPRRRAAVRSLPGILQPDAVRTASRPRRPKAGSVRRLPRSVSCFHARAWSMSVTAAGSARTAPASGGTQPGLSAPTLGVSPLQSPPG